MKKLICISGAGLSADSGIQTFRGGTGLWEGVDINEVCNHLTWKRNAEKVHAFYNGLRAGLADKEPNPMHQLLVDWQKRFDAVLITQNVDNLLERAGAADVIHLHGFLEEMLCEACGTVWNVGYKSHDYETETCPKCPCRKGVKPNVVFFNERAPRYLDMRKVFSGIDEDSILVVIGTDGAVVPVGQIASAFPGKKVLNNLAPVPEAKWQPGMVHPALFNHVIYRPAAQAVEEIDQVVTEWMQA